MINTKKNNIRFKRITALLLIMILSLPFVEVFASYPTKYITLNKPTEVVVVEVIDGDSLLVQVTDTYEYAYVKMIGLNTQAYDRSYEYVTQILLGETVYVVPDSKIRSPIEKWNQMYVYIGDINFNDFLLEEGYSKVDNAYDTALAYNHFIGSQLKAKDKELNIWEEYPNSLYATSNMYPNYSYPEKEDVPSVGTITGGSSPEDSKDDKNSNSSSSKNDYVQVNINTATAKQISYYIEDISKELANSIVKYRDSVGYFTRIDQLMKVEGFTRMIYDDTKDYFVRYTDINSAEEQELETLNLPKKETENIIKYRERYNFKSKNELVSQNLVSKANYDKISKFVYVDKASGNNWDDEKNMKVNINTASKSQLTDLLYDISDDLARRIVEYRSSNPFSSISDIREVSGMTFDIYDQNYDIMTVSTNLNNTSINELETLGLTISQADEVLDYVDRKGYVNSSNFLYETNIISRSTYDEIKAFIRPYEFIEENNENN